MPMGGTEGRDWPNSRFLTSSALNAPSATPALEDEFCLLALAAPARDRAATHIRSRTAKQSS